MVRWDIEHRKGDVEIIGLPVRNIRRLKEKVMLLRCSSMSNLGNCPDVLIMTEGHNALSSMFSAKFLL